MIVTLLFILLALLATTGATGVLFLKKTRHCAIAFLLCCIALVGLCLLLNMVFLALVQLFATLMMAGLLAVGTSNNKHESTLSRRQRLKWLPVALILIAVVIWAVVQGRIGAPLLQSVPVWASRGEHIATFGQEMVDNHLVLLELVGLFLLASMVSIAHLTRQSLKASNSNELDRLSQQRAREQDRENRRNVTT